MLQNRDPHSGWTPDHRRALRATPHPGNAIKSPEIFFQDATVDRGERVQIGESDPLVYLVRGSADEPELHHRTAVLDEAGVRRAARSGACRLLPGNFGDRTSDEVDEWSRLGEKDVGVRGRELQPPAHLPGGCLATARLDQALERFPRVAIVEADVEARARLPRNQVDGSIADVDRSELQVRRIE